MTFTPLSTNLDRSTEDSHIQPLKFSQISVATSLLAILGMTFLQALLWMPASTPAELPTERHRQQCQAKFN